MDSRFNGDKVQPYAEVVCGHTCSVKDKRCHADEKVKNGRVWAWKHSLYSLTIIGGTRSGPQASSIQTREGREDINVKNELIIIYFGYGRIRPEPSSGTVRKWLSNDLICKSKGGNGSAIMIMES